MDHSLPAVEEKGGFLVKLGGYNWPYVHLSKFVLLCLIYEEGLIQALVPIE